MARTSRGVSRVGGVRWCSCVGGPSPPPPLCLSVQLAPPLRLVLLSPRQEESQRQRLLHPGTAIVNGLLFYEWLLWGICFLFCLLMHGGGGVDGQCVTYLNCTLTFPPSPPTLPCPLFGSVPCLRAKHSSYSRNPSRQGPSWLARHFCNNYPSALDLVLALALVALVLGVIYRGSIVLRLFNWSFDFWFACY